MVSSLPHLNYIVVQKLGPFRCFRLALWGCVWPVFLTVCSLCPGEEWWCGPWRGVLPVLLGGQARAVSCALMLARWLVGLSAAERGCFLLLSGFVFTLRPCLGRGRSLCRGGGGKLRWPPKLCPVSHGGLSSAPATPTAGFHVHHVVARSQLGGLLVPFQADRPHPSLRFLVLFSCT